MLIGYMDDSGSTKTYLLTLSCVVSHGSQWWWFEKAWERVLEKKNEQLAAAGRPTISRYHAADCNSRLKEFKGWTVEEQTEFTLSLIRVFQRHATGVSAYSIDLRDLTEEFPEAKEDPKSLGHGILLTNVIWYIANNILGDKRWKTDRFALVHDRGSYDGVLLNTFNSLKEDETLKHHKLLASIESAGWGDEIRLQAADFLAFESFKIIERQRSDRERRKSMQAVLDLPSFGGRASLILPAGLKDIRGKLNEETLRLLFRNARIRLPGKSR